MNIFNRYFMRPTGERKFQPVGNAEKTTFGAFDFLKESGLLNDKWNEAGEVEKNAIMESFCQQMQRSLDN